jgi:diguanylate cyclase (GGDEF)-like protein/PAS domain S-box-containing protein
MTTRVVISLFLALTSCLGLFLVRYAARRRHLAGAGLFALFVAACSVYAMGYLGEIWAGSLGAILIFIRVEYLGIAFIPSLWLLFVLDYTGRRAVPAFRYLLLGLSTLTFVLVLFVGSHSLFYVRPHLDLSGPFPTLAFGRGPWYWVHVSYTWLSFVSGQILLLVFLVRAPSFYKPQVALTAIAEIIPLVVFALYLCGDVPDHLDPTPVSFAFFTAPLAWALFRLQFLESVPVARERVLEALEDGVLVLDTDGRIVDANPAAQRMLGLGGGRVGRPIAEMVPDAFGLSALVAAGSGSAEFGAAAGTGDNDAGGERRYRARAFRVRGGHGRELGTALIVSDVTETSALLARLDALAGSDSLTGLFNRRRFFEYALREFELALRNVRPIAVCVIDLDHFKDVNDRYGHAAGDDVLKEAASRFSLALRSTDIICRYGGEEFAMLLPNSDIETGRRAAERLRLRLCETPITFKDGSTSVSASFGVFGSVPCGVEDLDRFLGLADEALYAAKAGGRNRVALASSGSVLGGLKSGPGAGTGISSAVSGGDGKPSGHTA